MKKRMLWKDIFHSITHSLGRFLAIFCLMALGVFAFVGLKVTGPDMRLTAENFFTENHLADLSIISTYGLDESDQQLIQTANQLDLVEYGYLKDVVIKETDESIRIFSATRKLSQYKIVSGSLPNNNDEIALDYLYEGEYAIGDTIEFTEEGNTILKKHRFTVVGFVKSSEIINKTNIGETTVGTGKLNGYAVVSEDVFHSDVYMIARLSFTDTKNLNAYSDEYNEFVQTHKKELKSILQNQPELRLETIQDEKQADIDDGWDKINEAKQELADIQTELDHAKQQIDDAKAEVAENQKKLDTEVANAQVQIDDGQQQLDDAQASINNAEGQLKEAQQQLASGQTTLNEKWAQLQAGKSQLDDAKQVLDQTFSQLSNAATAIQEGKTKLESAHEQIAQNEQALLAAQNEINANQQAADDSKAILAEKQAEINAQQATLNEKQTEAKQAQSEIDNKQTALNANKAELENGKANYEEVITQLKNSISAGKEQIAALQSQQASLEDAILQLEAAKAEAEQAGDFAKAEEIQAEINVMIAQLNEVAAGIVAAKQDLAEAEHTLETAQSEYEGFMTNTYKPGMAAIGAGQTELDDVQAQIDAANQQIAVGQAKIDAAQAQVDDGNKQLAESQAKIDAAQAQVNASTKQLNEAKTALAQQEANLASKEQQYEDGLTAYNQGVSAYNENLQSYYSRLEQWKHGVESLNLNSAEYQHNVEKLAQAKAELADKENELAEAKSELARKQAESQQQIDEVNDQIASKENEYIENREQFENEKSEAEADIAENEQDLKNAEEALHDLALPVYTVGDRKDNAGYKNYLENSQRIDVLSNVFPVFLFAIAVLVTLTTMTRFVEEQRINIGTLKALGYTNKDIQKKFVVYGFVSSSLGAAVGAVLGHTILPIIIFNAYAATANFAKIELQFYPLYTMMAFVIAILCAVLPAHLVASKELREQPASLLLPKPPKASSKILLERIKPIWNRMSFTYKVTARNLFRYKKRMFMTIFGVAGCTALLITGFGLQDSLTGIVERQFQEIINYDLIVVNNDELSDSETKELNKMLNDAAIQDFSTVHFEQLTTIAGKYKDTQNITLLVPEDEEMFSKFVTLQNRKSRRKINLTNDGVVISERLAELLDVSVGDTIKLTDSNDEAKKMRVSGITEMYTGHYAFMNKAQYAEIFGEDILNNASLVTLKDQSASSVEKNAADFISLSAVKGVQQNIQLKTQINSIMNGLNKVVLVLIIVSTMLAAVVIYNLTNINVSERIRELSTIKVLGFYDKEVTLYIYRETIILSILGILEGYVIGFFLHSFIIHSLPPDNAMFSPDLLLSNFVLSAAITIFITLVIMIVMHFKIKHVNMLDALKSVE